MVKRSDYVQINSAPDEEDEEEDGEESSPFPTQIELPSTTTMNNDNNNESSSSIMKLKPPHKLHKNPSATALHVDELFNKWTKTIAEKVHIKNNNNKGRNKNKVGVRVIEDRDRDLKIEIMASVFEVWVKKDDGDLKGKGKELNENEMMMTLDHLDPMSRETFDL